MATFHPVPIALERAARRHIRPISFFATAFIALIITIFAGLYIGFAMVARSEYIFQGVTVGGVDVGNTTYSRLAEQVSADWQAREIILTTTNGDVTVSPVEMGVQIDAEYVANAAWSAGRDSRPWWLAPLRAMSLNQEVPPRYIVDDGIASMKLQQLADALDVLPIQPQIVIVDGVAMAEQGVAGSAIDLEASLALWQEGWFSAVENGRLQLVMQSVNPAAYAMDRYVGEVNAFLAQPLQLTAYDPIRDETIDLTVSAENWGAWVQFNVVDDVLTTDGNLDAITQYIEVQNAQFDNRYISTRDASAVATAIRNRAASADLRIFHPDRVHTVEFGETLASIGTDYGIPYPYLEQINQGIDPTELRPGQEITVPSPDSMIPLPVLRGKRIIVNLGQQRMTAYENGQVKWDWPISSGIPGSPTSPGIFQVQTHVENAYAGTWDLDLPYFMGFYRPVPDIDFMNGFHGFPTQEDGTVVWTDRIGEQGTYGCVLVADSHIVTLYDWAESGMIVEIVQ